MKIGTVMGTVEQVRCAAGLEDIRWVQVRLGTDILVAADPVGVSAGQMVLLATGDAAGHYRMDYCTDAIVVALLVEKGNNG